MSSNTREGWTWPSGVAKGGSDIEMVTEQVLMKEKKERNRAKIEEESQADRQKGRKEGR